MLNHDEYVRRGKLAYYTKWDNKLKSYIESTQSYDRPLKNIDRSEKIKIIKETKLTELHRKENIWLLETPEFLFVNEYPDANYTIIERDKDGYKLMEHYKPKQVKNLIFGELQDKATIDYLISLSDYPDILYLDGMGTKETIERILISLIDKIKLSRMVIVTFCVRGRKTTNKLGDANIGAIKDILDILGNDWEFNHKYSGGQYNDDEHATMWTGIFYKINRVKLRDILYPLVLSKTHGNVVYPKYSRQAISQKLRENNPLVVQTPNNLDIYNLQIFIPNESTIDKNIKIFNNYIPLTKLLLGISNFRKKGKRIICNDGKISRLYKNTTIQFNIGQNKSGIYLIGNNKTSCLLMEKVEENKK